MTLRENVHQAVREAVRRGQLEGALPANGMPDFHLEVPKESKFGDYSCNLALVWARGAKRNPREIARAIVERLPDLELVREVAVEGPGFINFFMSHRGLQEVVRGILRQGADCARSNLGSGMKVQVEFVSANPVGPMHVGHGRWAAVGDTVARLLEVTDHEVQREFYINDRGVQMRTFAHSLYVRLLQAAGREMNLAPEDYQGEYVTEMARRYHAQDPGLAALDEGEAIERLSELGYVEVMEWIRRVLERCRVRFDNFFSEREMHAGGEVERVLERLRGHGAVYEKDGATWFEATRYGESKDKVLIKSDGECTYFLSDIAYHANKFDRGFDHVIALWGADHAGHVLRMKGAMQALGFEPDHVEVLIGQHVHLIALVPALDDAGNPKLDAEGNAVTKKAVVKMSKRTGRFYTFEDLLDEFGPDIVRFFFLQHSANSTLEFDLDLAAEASDKNPVYRVQYAHARVSSIFRRACDQGVQLSEDVDEVDLSALGEAAEVDLIRTLEGLPWMVRQAALRREPHHIPAYALNLAGLFHTFYNQHRILGEAPAITQARLALARSVQFAIEACCRIMGVDAPDRM